MSAAPACVDSMFITLQGTGTRGVHCSLPCRAQVHVVYTVHYPAGHRYTWCTLESPQPAGLPDQSEEGGDGPRG